MKRLLKLLFKRLIIKRYIDDIYDITNICDGYVISRGYAIKIIEVIPVNICSLNEEENNNIYISYKKLLKECDFKFKIISSSYKVDISTELDYKTEVDNEIWKTEYINELKELNKEKEIQIKRFFIAFEGLKLNEINTNEQLERDFERKYNVFMNLECCGVKLREIENQKEILNILRRQFRKE